MSGYPTLKVFRQGIPTDYAGPRKADGIVSYMLKWAPTSETRSRPDRVCPRSPKSLPRPTESSSSLTRCKRRVRFVAECRVMMAYGDDAHPIPHSYVEYANTARDSYVFGQYTTSPLPTIPESPPLPAIVLYKSFDEGYAVFDPSEAGYHSTAMASFVKINSVPLMDEISPENFGSYAEQGLPIAYLFVDPEDIDTLHKMVTELTPLAKELKGKVNFVYIDGIKFVDHGKSLNLPGDSFPSFVVQDLAKQTKFPLTETASKSSIEAFMKKYLAGDIAPSVKSQPVPGSQDGPVYTLVAEGWNQLFDDESKDVFAEFFAPWCGHCREWPAR